MKESYARRETRSRSPSGSAGTAPRRRAFRFGFPCCFGCLFRGVCLAAAGEARRTRLCQAHATVPNRFFIYQNIKYNDDIFIESSEFFSYFYVLKNVAPQYKFVFSHNTFWFITTFKRNHRSSQIFVRSVFCFSGCNTIKPFCSGGVGK